MAPGAHAGVVVCTSDPDFHRLALRIHELIGKEDAVAGKALGLSAGVVIFRAPVTLIGFAV